MATENQIPETDDTVVAPVTDDMEQLLGISDDDFAKLEVPTAPIEEPTVTSQDEPPVGSTNTDNTDGTPVSTEQPGEATGNSENKDTTVVDPGSTDEKPPENTDPQIDYKAEYEKLIAPFKANGTEIQVRNSDEIMTLMQMGANYHKKMAALKPALKTVKFLEKHGLLDENKLSYLVDLHNKNPQAIQKLVKESGIDPLDINVSEDTNYTPQAQGVSDVEMQLETVLENIQHTPTYNRTLTVVTNDWDIPSRNVIAANPAIIEVLNGQIASGIYDTVMSEVNRAKALGHFQGISDLDAYKQMGDFLHSQGKLNIASPASKPPVNAPVDTAAQQREADRIARRKAAGAPPTKKASAPSKQSNLLSLSDEEFEKLPPTAYTTIR